jgi:cytidine deaminase
LNNRELSDHELVELAKSMLPKAYVPYSKFPVGAAIFCDDGKVYTGCNIENAAYGPTICAERSALCGAVCDGNLKIERVAIIANTEDYCYPCGVCRQTLYEFNPKIRVICARRDGEFVIHELSELLPHAFGPAMLDK